MRIKILGTGTSVPSIKRLSSSCLIESDGKKILVDLGPSVVRRLLEIGFHVFDIDIVILTHFHVDHSADLSTFLFTCNYGLRPRREPLFLIGGKGIKRFLSSLMDIYPWIRPKDYSLSVFPLGKESFSLEGIVIDGKKVNHNKESIAIRLKAEGKSIVISGDTDYSRNLINLSKNCNLLIMECSFPERKVNKHMNLKTVAKIVGLSNPERVILTHLYPEWDDYKEVLPEPFSLGIDFMEIEL